MQNTIMITAIFYCKMIFDDRGVGKSLSKVMIMVTVPMNETRCER
jgi:hypothetical protein